MSSPERFNPENQDSLWDRRKQIDEQVGKPRPWEARIVAYQHKLFLKNLSFHSFFSDKNRLAKYLAKEFKEFNEIFTDSPYSRFLICASLVDYAKHAVLTAVKDIPVSETRGFMVFFDTAHGMGLLAESAWIAEKQLRNPLGNPLSDIIDASAERFYLPASEFAQIFLNTRQFSSYLAQLLKKDPSGESLTEEIVRFLKNPKYLQRMTGIDDMIPSFTARGFVVAGAEAGKDLVKKMYPLTKNLS